MPVAIGLGIASLLAIIITGEIPLASIPHKMVNGLDSYVFIAIPLFLFAGRLMNAGGITDRLFRFARVLVGTISGGLAHANVMAGMFFSAISGSAVATVGGLGEIEMKAMRENGYDDDFAASVAIASSVLGPVIPPSIPLIIYASMTDNSVGKLFLGGIIPGIMLALSLMILIYVISKKRKYPRDKRPLLMPVIMLGGIYSGIFTPTEAAAVAGLYALFVSLYIYKTIQWKDLPKILVETMVTTAVVTLVISTTSGFSFILSLQEAGDSLINFISGVTNQKIVVLLIINILLLIFGAVMEAGVVLILFIPVLYPLAVSLGIDPIHFGVIMAVNLMIGVATPPMGMCLFVMSQISGIKLERLMRKILIFLVPLIFVLILITYIPGLVTVLPNASGKSTAQSSGTMLPDSLMTKHEAFNRNHKQSYANEHEVISVGLTHSPGHSFTKALNIFKYEFEKKTGGRYEIKIFHSSRIGNEKEMQEMLTLGSVDISVTGVLNTYNPDFALLELPYLYKDRDHIIRVMNSSITDSMSKVLENSKLTLLGFYENGFRHITNSVHPVNTPEDLNGLVIRTPENPAQIQTMKSLGANPTPMSFSELYTALIQGVVDGQENPLQNIWYGRLYEAQVHLSLTSHIYNSAYVIGSTGFWKNLPEEDRQIFKECLSHSSLWQMNYMEELDKILLEKIKEYGVQITRPDVQKFRSQTSSVYQTFYEILGPQAESIVEQIRALEN
jgi:tripartite ATP-independent transporter DctM subunit/tripartite ATP-independent transporter DctP family solute receptor